MQIDVETRRAEYERQYSIFNTRCQKAAISEIYKVLANEVEPDGGNTDWLTEEMKLEIVTALIRDIQRASKPAIKN